MSKRIVYGAGGYIPGSPGGNVIDEAEEPDPPEMVEQVARQVVTLDLHARARQALTDNASFLAVGTPTQAQTLAQVRRLTRQVNALIRLTIAGDLIAESTDV
jgi:hypothetical protein